MSEMQDLVGRVAQWVRSARICPHRRGLVLSGTRAWTMETSRLVLAASGLEQVLWVGDTPAGAGGWQVPIDKAPSVLGQEAEAVVYDAYGGFDPDAFGATSGLVVGGGLLVLQTPPLMQWPDYPDPQRERITVYPFPPSAVGRGFLRRFVQRIRGAEGLWVVEEGRPLPPPPVAAAGVPPPPASVRQEGAEGATAACRTADQRRAVEALIKVVSGQRRRPVVLMSDRGRGKSAAMGIAAARLLREGAGHIVVTGPSLSAVAPIFSHARDLLPGAHASRAAIHLGARHMEYLAPDQLLRMPAAADLVLVDEAATLPTPLLEQLLRRSSRIAFATTVHGYEGTGRGFTLRFARILDRHTRGWRRVNLETPIRWAPGDPIERFVFQSLLLDASPVPDADLRTVQVGECRIERLDRDRLADDEETLAELFGLLVLAHYRTRPYDLRHLLDGPNVSVYAMRHAGHVVGTALLAREGGFDAVLAQAIGEGRTRPHGHLIPETLAAHVGLTDAPRRLGARVVRLAIHPLVQGRGLGSRLLRHLLEAAGREGLDYVGSSFGATPGLLRFWDRAGFVPLRLSVRRGASSGAHSALVLCPLSASGSRLVSEARARFREAMPYLLADPLQDLDAELALQLLYQAGRAPGLELSRQDWLDLIAFAQGHRIYEACLAPVFKLVMGALTEPGCGGRLGSRERVALVRKVVQRHGWLEVARAVEASGRAGVVAILRKAIRELIEASTEADA